MNRGIKRYNSGIVTIANEDPKGEWVKYEDHIKSYLGISEIYEERIRELKEDFGKPITQKDVSVFHRHCVQCGKVIEGSKDGVAAHGYGTSISGKLIVSYTCDSCYASNKEEG